MNNYFLFHKIIINKLLLLLLYDNKENENHNIDCLQNSLCVYFEKAGLRALFVGVERGLSQNGIPGGN